MCTSLEAAGQPAAHGLEPVRQRFTSMFRAFPDLVAEPRRMLGDGQWVCHEVVMRGTHKGPFRVPDGRELPATGKEVRFPMCGLLRVEGGKVVEVHDYLDRLGLLAQLGALEATPS